MSASSGRLGTISSPSPWLGTEFRLNCSYPFQSQIFHLYSDLNQRSQPIYSLLEYSALIGKQWKSDSQPLLYKPPTNDVVQIMSPLKKDIGYMYQEIMCWVMNLSPVSTHCGLWRWPLRNREHVNMKSNACLRNLCMSICDTWSAAHNGHIINAKFYVNV